MIGRSVYLMGYGDVSVELSQVSHRPSEGGRLPTYMDVYDERSVLNVDSLATSLDVCTTRRPTLANKDTENSNPKDGRH